MARIELVVANRPAAAVALKRAIVKRITWRRQWTSCLHANFAPSAPAAAEEFLHRNSLLLVNCVCLFACACACVFVCLCRLFGASRDALNSFGIELERLEARAKLAAANRRLLGNESFAAYFESSCLFVCFSRPFVFARRSDELPVSVPMAKRFAAAAHEYRPR